MDTFQKRRFNKGWNRSLWLAATAFVLAILAGTVQAALPSGVNITFQGCRNNGDILLPNDNGEFICPDGVYTSGNLGKGWDELDLVPFRVTLAAGNSAPDNQTYDLAVVLDYINSNRTGYDVLSVPKLNMALSHPSCAEPTVSDALEADPGIGGTDISLYRLLNITQQKNTACVYDFYGRLALGASQYPGSSLHANLTNENLGTGGIGARDISIPVREIQPQELRKDMAATQDADHIWNLTKAADPASVSFGDVCAEDFVPEKQVTFRVEWTKLEATPGQITVVTNIYAKNPASRTITVNVTDDIYKGLTQDELLDSKNSGDVDVPAETELLVLTHEKELGNDAGSIGDYLNDVATATYTDKVTGVPVPGQTMAQANAQIASGDVTNASADIKDREWITGDGLTFSVAQPSIGDFIDYIANTPTTGPVDWKATGQTNSGFVDFFKTILLDGKQVTSGKLIDVAKLVGADGFTRTAGPVKVHITSDARVSLAIAKEIPFSVPPGQSVIVSFRITGPNGFEQVIMLEIEEGESQQSQLLQGLQPGTYEVTEIGIIDGDGRDLSDFLKPEGGFTQTVDITASACAGSATFINGFDEGGPASARVQKITDPAPGMPGFENDDLNWEMTLSCNEGDYLESKTVVAGGGFLLFDRVLEQGDSCTITELLKDGWDQTYQSSECSFSVSYPSDLGRVFSCTYKNTKRGEAEVVKTVSGNPLTGDESFTFQLREGASQFAEGTILETKVASSLNGGSFKFDAKLVPGNDYQLCELVYAGWNTDLGNYGTLFVPGSIIPPNLPNMEVNNLPVCVNFTVAAGETKTFNVDNTPPPGGRGLTIGFWKNHSSCTGGNQDPVLDETLASFTGGGVLIGALFVDTCEEAVAILDKRDLKGRKRASDAGFNAAAQLLAYRLNAQKGSYTCQAAMEAAEGAQAILAGYGFDGYKLLNNRPLAQQLNNYAHTLDLYNNNMICQ